MGWYEENEKEYERIRREDTRVYVALCDAGILEDTTGRETEKYLEEDEYNSIQHGTARFYGLPVRRF